MPKISQKSLPYKVLQNIKKNDLIQSGNRVIIALSGGPDSVCLFYVLLGLKKKLGVELKVCHYNHRLRGRASYNDSEFVKKLADKNKVDFLYGEAPADNLFSNEDSARRARYDFFEKILAKEGRGAKIALAHNADDAVETVLLRLARGTGLLGLKSIPLQRKKFVRPLLPFSRKEISFYLECEKLPFRVDKTNFDKKIPRNFIRLEILPRFQRLNPSFTQTVQKTISLLADDYEFLSLAAKKEFANAILTETQGRVILSHKKWLALHPSIQRLVLREAIDKVGGLSDISLAQIDEVHDVLLRGEGKKHKILPRSLRIELSSGKIVIVID